MVSNASRSSLGLLATAALGLVLAVSGSGRAAGTGPRIVRDLGYVAGAGPGQQLDLYLPSLPGPGPATARAPLFVYMHGGAWVSGDKRQYAALGLALSAQGVAVAIPNYRLSGDGPDAVRHPTHAQDAAAAVAWLRKGAATYGYDPARVFVGGHSAGAHMSALLALDGGLLSAVGERPESIRGFVGIEGIYDLPELVRRFPSYRVDFLQAAFSGDEGTWRQASPLYLIGAGAGAASAKRPWLLIHSREDELVDTEQSRRFEKALSPRGVPVRLVSPDHGSHFGIIGELATPGSPLGQQLLAFLRS